MSTWRGKGGAVLAEFFSTLEGTRGDDGSKSSGEKRSAILKISAGKLLFTLLPPPPPSLPPSSRLCLLSSVSSLELFRELLVLLLLSGPWDELLGLDSAPLSSQLLPLRPTPIASSPPVAASFFVPFPPPPVFPFSFPFSSSLSPSSLSLSPSFSSSANKFFPFDRRSVLCRWSFRRQLRRPSSKSPMG